MNGEHTTQQIKHKHKRDAGRTTYNAHSGRAGADVNFWQQRNRKKGSVESTQGMASFYKREIDTILWNIGTRDATLATVVRLMSRGYFGFKEVGLEAFPCQPRESIRAARCTHAKHRTAFGKTPFSTKILHHRIAMEKSARNGNNFLFIFKKALSSEKSHTFTRPAIQV